MNRLELIGPPWRTVIVLTAVLLFLACASLFAPEASAASRACAEAVQGKIAWDYKGSKRWKRTSIRRLCKGAMHSTQPARCFKRVMHSGKVNWGGGTRWQPRNALKLCRGTTNASSRIRCFQDSISKGLSWQRAIRKCRSVAAGKSAGGKSAGGDTRTVPRIDPKVISALAGDDRDSRCEGGGDRDGDGHVALECGGDDCDDDDASRYPGNTEVCDASGHDEDCDPATLAGGGSGGRRPAGVPADGDEDGDGFISAQCCNEQSDGRLRCGPDPDDRSGAKTIWTQWCRDSRTIVVGGDPEPCPGRCVPQPNGTGICLPAR